MILEVRKDILVQISQEMKKNGILCPFCYWKCYCYLLGKQEIVFNTIISKQDLCETSSPYVYVFAVCLLSFSVVAKDKNRFHRVNGNGKWDIQPTINYISNVIFKVILCKYCGKLILVKPGQNKKGQKKFQLHRFLNLFLQR